MRPRYNKIEAFLSDDLLNSLVPDISVLTGRLIRATGSEDDIYQDLHQERGGGLFDTEKQSAEKLPGFPSFTQDIFQSLYAPEPQFSDEGSLAPAARKLHKKLLSVLTGLPGYIPMKALCGGQALPAFEAAMSFAAVIAEHLDELLRITEGDKNSLTVLISLEQRRERLKQELWEHIGKKNVYDKLKTRQNVNR